jgi:hypothetical protein
MFEIEDCAMNDRKHAQKKKNRENKRKSERAGGDAAVLQRAMRTRRNEHHDELAAKTETLVAAGTRPEALLWVITADQADVILAETILANLRTSGDEDRALEIEAFMKSLSTGNVCLTYSGPEGVGLEAIHFAR